jgi:hypothetical protein
MKTASGLTFVAVGAILAFAVTAHPSFFNIQVAGWVVMLIGLAGIFAPRKGAGWRRRLVTSWAPGGLVRDRSGRVYPPPRPSIETAELDIDGPVGQADAVPAGEPAMARETVEEFIEE